MTTNSQSSQSANLDLIVAALSPSLSLIIGKITFRFFLKSLIYFLSMPFFLDMKLFLEIILAKLSGKSGSSSNCATLSAVFTLPQYFLLLDFLLSAIFFYILQYLSHLAQPHSFVFSKLLMSTYAEHIIIIPTLTIPASLLHMALVTLHTITPSSKIWDFDILRGIHYHALPYQVTL